jgi:Polysaccharide lyase family 4, domain II
MRLRTPWLTPLLALGLIGAPGAVVPVDAYDAVQVTDGGTIQGKVSFPGTPPSKKKVIPTKDREACGSAPRDVDQILLGPDKTVQDAVVYLQKVDKGKAWEKPGKPPEINNVKCDFIPHVQVMPVGDLDIVNSDPVLHNTHGFLDKLTVFNVALPNEGQRIKRPLRKSGLVRVECDAHGWMLGWILVAENPYYAMTGKDGSFTIKDVPPGAYTLVVWQEFTGPVEVPVTVKAKEVVSVPVELKKK